MARFLFHLNECGVETNDESGREFSDLDSAMSAAVADARSIMAHDVRDGHLCLSYRIEIEEQATGTRTTLVFKDVLTITGE